MGVEGLEGEVVERTNVYRIPANKSDLGIIIEVGLSPQGTRLYTGIELEAQILRLNHATESGLIKLDDSGEYRTGWFYHRYSLTPEGMRRLHEVVDHYEQNVAAKPIQKSEEATQTVPPN